MSGTLTVVIINEHFYCSDIPVNISIISALLHREIMELHFYFNGNI